MKVFFTQKELAGELGRTRQFVAAMQRGGLKLPVTRQEAETFLNLHPHPMKFRAAGGRGVEQRTQIQGAVGVGCGAGLGHLRVGQKTRNSTNSKLTYGIKSNSANQRFAPIETSLATITKRTKHMTKNRNATSHKPKNKKTIGTFSWPRPMAKYKAQVKAT